MLDGRVGKLDRMFQPIDGLLDLIQAELPVEAHGRSQQHVPRGNIAVTFIGALVPLFMWSPYG